jgi:hypothetical protein
MSINLTARLQHNSGEQTCLLVQTRSQNRYAWKLRLQHWCTLQIRLLMHGLAQCC